jgi:hypothetical protein
VPESVLGPPTSCTAVISGLLTRAPTTVSHGGPSQVTKTPSEAPQFSCSVYSHWLSEVASKSSQT